jgi:aspartate-semialdehyde dehydrogenase
VSVLTNSVIFSKQFGPIAVDQGCIVVDNSSAFRMDEGVPLVIPEVICRAIPNATYERVFTSLPLSHHLIVYNPQFLNGR